MRRPLHRALCPLCLAMVAAMLAPACAVRTHQSATTSGEDTDRMAMVVREHNGSARRLDPAGCIAAVALVVRDVYGCEVQTDVFGPDSLGIRTVRCTPVGARPDARAIHVWVDDTCAIRDMR